MISGILHMIVQPDMRKIIWLVMAAGTFIIQLMAPQAIATVLTDQLGHRITLPQTPQRVISLAPSITEIVFAVGREHRLVGVSRFSDYPPAASKLPRVGSYTQPDLERIVALKPDLCFATKDGNPRQVVERLRSLGIPVYAVNPQNLDGIMSTILDIGTLLGASERARALVETMQSKVDNIKSVIKKAHSRPRVFFQIGISPIEIGRAHV